MSVDDTAERIGRGIIAILILPVTLPMDVSRWVWELCKTAPAPTEKSSLPQAVVITKRDHLQRELENFNENVSLVDDLPLDEFEKHAAKEDMRAELGHKVKDILK